MNTDEKLYHFKEEALQNASQKGASALDAYQKGLEAEYKSHVRSQKSASDMQIRLAKENLRREHNRKISKAGLDTRRSLTLTRMEIEDDLFSAVSVMIEDFKKRDAYLQSLLDMIEDAKKQAKSTDIQVMVDKTDAELIPMLEKSSGKSVIISQDNIIGGILATIPGSNILIDLSYSTKLREAREGLKFGGNYGK